MESKTETVIDNKLIDKFMGANPIEDIPYDKDWSLLMPVVEKIETMNFSVMVIRKYTRIECANPYKEFSTDICETKIKAVYKAVVEFIKFYNDQNKALH